MHYKPWSMNKLCFKLFPSFQWLKNKLHLTNCIWCMKKMLLKTTFSFLKIMWLLNSNTGVGFGSIITFSLTNFAFKMMPHYFKKSTIKLNTSLRALACIRAHLLNLSGFQIFYQEQQNNALLGITNLSVMLIFRVSDLMTAMLVVKNKSIYFSRDFILFSCKFCKKNF